MPDVPVSKTVPKKQSRLPLVWIVPIAAAVLGAWVAITRIMSEGPTIAITLDSAEGLEAGKTQIHYNGVEIGTLKTIRLSDDHQKVIATAQMAPKTEDLLVDDTVFWVVRPRISGANVSGLGTLISGAYLGMEIGRSSKYRRDFVALSVPPVVTMRQAGRYFVLKTANLGSLDTGTPLYFRRLQVGQVVSYALDADGKALTVKVFVDAPYDAYVTRDTRFWHASGVDLSLSATGLNVQTQSLLSILVGGIAFETPASDPPARTADENAVFTLFEDRADAFEPAAREPQNYLLVFRQSVRGLAVGAPFEFRGIKIGEVTRVEPQFDAKTFEFSVLVGVQLDPMRFGVEMVNVPDKADIVAAHRRVVDALVARGGRAILKTGNLLTGALYVSLDFFPDAPPASIDWSQNPPRFPTQPGQLEAIEANVASIIKKIDAMPLEAIGTDLKNAIAELDRTLASARGTLGTADRLIAPNSTLATGLDNTLAELNRAARSLRVLMDYLERHPEALLRGKSEGGK
jgi:paraquat-inducible protein B